MNARAFAVLFVLASALPVRTQQVVKAGPTTELPPISWTCPMHPDVVESKKGTCPQCRMDLVPVRLTTVWTCPVHGVIEQDTPGKCRICSRDLVQATRALTFTCAGHPEVNQIDPGQCADGTPTIAKYTPRPHGDHNPKHGGLFFMAPDNWHHIEGAYPAAGRFRVYVYDDYSKPLTLADARKVRGRIVTKEVFDSAARASRELSSAPLVLARNGAFFEARIDPLALPAQMTAKISFGSDDKESRFDFSFPAYSKDVPTPLPAPVSSAPASPAAKTAGGPTAALLTDLKARDQEVASLVKNGMFGGIYVPALQAKDLALQIQARQGSASSTQRQAIETRVKQLVVAAYQLDNYGDLGDAQKISEAYRSFSAAVAAIDSLLEARP
jgi:hypothetical protein